MVHQEEEEEDQLSFKTLITSLRRLSGEDVVFLGVHHGREVGVDLIAEVVVVTVVAVDIPIIILMVTDLPRERILSGLHKEGKR